MEQGFTSLLTDDELSKISLSLLQNVMDVVSASIQVIRAVRDQNDEIIDFEYVLLNHSPGNKSRLGKSFLTENPTKTEIFKQLVNEHNKESGSMDSFLMDNKTDLSYTRYKKLGDGILLSIEDTTEQAQLQEKIEGLYNALSAANHELATANLELQTFSSIAANDYKETLKHLYTSLEYITTAEAPNLSHTGRANIRRSQAAIQKMKLLTEDIIVYSTIQNLDGSEISVDLVGIFEMIKKHNDKKIKEEDIEIDCSDLPVIKGHHQLLTLLFHHLVDNAIKFNQPGKKSTIHIRCAQQEGPSIDSPVAIKGKKYDVVSITDNGHGFSPELG